MDTQQKEKIINDIKDKIVQFDSSSAMLNALSAYFKDRPFTGGGVTSANPLIGDLINAFPKPIREFGYRWSGWMDALSPRKILDLKTENISRWVVNSYPERVFPGMMFGSSNGASMHLAAALGIPWIPQTYLLAIRRFLDPDEIKKDMEWGKEMIRPFLSMNPNLQAHQMHDPLQDRLMVSKMGYFRLKYLSLGEVLTEFVTRQIQQDGFFMTVECTFKWPVFRLGDRHVFQLGGFGALNGKEYLEGGPQVQEFLKRVKAPVKGWDMPDNPEDMPESEWGFIEDGLHELKKLAKKNNWKFRRLIFDHPEGLSPFVADLYDWWYKKRGIKSRRLIFESFGVVEPFWTLKTGSLPFWLAFNTLCSYECAEKYLKNKSFDEIYMMLMSNGVAESIGLTSIQQWRNILKQARKKSDFIGVNEKAYPFDFGTFLKYSHEFGKKVTARVPPPAPLKMEELEQFIGENKGRYKLEWRDE